jgi:hypothetical protein
VLVLATSLVKKSQGPYWLGNNSDPAYYYLVNALTLCDGQFPQYRDHPGIPLTALEALLILPTHAARGGDGLVQDVLKNPELYLSVTNVAVAFLWFVSLLIAGGMTLRRTGRLRTALLLQLTPFFSLTSLHYLPRAGPEALLALFAFWLAAVALLVLESGETPRYGRYSVAFGIVIALALATKLTAIPLLVVPVFLLPRKHKLIYAAIALAGFLIITLLLLNVYGRFADLMVHYLTRTGLYGSGGPGLIDLDAFVKNAKDLVVNDKVFAVVLTLSLAALLYARLVRTSVTVQDAAAVRKYHAGLLAVCLAELCQLVIVARHSPEDRYMIPAQQLLGLNIFLAYQLVRSTQPRYWPVLRALLCIGLCASLAVQVERFRQMRKVIYWEKTAQLMLCEVAQGYQECQIIYYFGSSSPLYALGIGNRVAGSHFADQLQTLHPHAVFYWGRGRYSDFAEFFDYQKAAKGHKCVLFQGFTFGNDLTETSRPSDLDLEQIYPKGRAKPYEEVLYKVIPDGRTGARES